jgi:uncharacterized DUF497 family protein
MLRVARLIWDAWNEAHIARHQVVFEEVEEVCHGRPIVSQTYGGRLRVVGPTAGHRILTVILAPQGEDIHYGVTARPADRKERHLYREQEGGIQP